MFTSLPARFTRDERRLSSRWLIRRHCSSKVNTDRCKGDCWVRRCESKKLGSGLHCCRGLDLYQMSQSGVLLNFGIQTIATAWLSVCVRKGVGFCESLEGPRACGSVRGLPSRIRPIAAQSLGGPGTVRCACYCAVVPATRRAVTPLMMTGHSSKARKQGDLKRLSPPAVRKHVPTGMARWIRVCPRGSVRAISSQARKRNGTMLRVSSGSNRWVLTRSAQLIHARAHRSSGGRSRCAARSGECDRFLISRAWWHGYRTLRSGALGRAV